MSYVSTLSMAKAIHKRQQLEYCASPEDRIQRTRFYNTMREAGYGSQPYTLRAMLARFCASEYVMNVGVPDDPSKEIVLDVKAIRSACEPSFSDEEGEGGEYIYTPAAVYRDIPVPARGAN